MKMGAKLHLSLLIAFIMGITFMNIASALETLMGLYKASFTMISLLMGALFWAHSLIQIPAGVLVDRLGLGRVLWLSLGLIGAGNLLATLDDSIFFAVVGRAMAGLGTGFSFPAIFKMYGVYAPPRRVGTYQASFGGVFALGCIAAYLGLPPLMSLGWRWAFLLPGLSGVALLGFALFLDFSRGAPQQVQGDKLSGIVRTPIAWITGIYHGLSWGVVLAVGSWLPSLLAETTGRGDSATFAWGGALLMLTSGLCRFLGGFILWRLPSGLIANGSLVLNAFIFAVLFVVREPWAVLCLSLGAVALASVNFGALFQIATQAGPKASMATFLGFVNLLANLGGMVNTMIFGWSKDYLGTFGAGFAPLALFCLLAVFFGGKPLNREARLQAGE